MAKIGIRKWTEMVLDLLDGSEVTALTDAAQEKIEAILEADFDLDSEGGCFASCVHCKRRDEQEALTEISVELLRIQPLSLGAGLSRVEKSFREAVELRALVTGRTVEQVKALVSAGLAEIKGEEGLQKALGHLLGIAARLGFELAVVRKVIAPGLLDVLREDNVVVKKRDEQ